MEHKRNEVGINNGRGSVRRKRIFAHWHKVAFFLVLYDVLAVNLAYLLALWIRFDCMYSRIPEYYLDVFIHFVPINTIIVLVVFWLTRLYKSIWRFASYTELVRIVVATFIVSVAHFGGITLLFKRMPVSYHIIGMGIQFILIVGVRFSYRFVLLERGRRDFGAHNVSVKRVMLIGAGAAGQMILRELNHAKEVRQKVCCIIDDNPNKWDRYIDGIPVVGGREDIFLNAEKYKIDQIFLAIPSASALEKRDILNICKETGCEIKTLPGIYQFVNDEVSVNQMREVAVEDLLGREPIKVNMEEIFDYITGKTILVTGGGGSIGSELCRQIAGHNPKRLIIFDVYENNAYEIEQELKAKYEDTLNLTVLIGSVRDSRRVNDIFEKYKPDVVYHAAAHKHVPLMEASPSEAIKNNVMGTYKTAYAALMNGCQRFVLISTDKAVNPTNIMGASKRLCEMVVQTMNKIAREKKLQMLMTMNAHSGNYVEQNDNISERQNQNITTEFVAVRFGNVLGSNGSVIPLFKKQIANGGPVTVTHPDIIRYFMTIPEAVSLVLQAGVYAKGGEIFVLDMGAPVKIDTLARNLIKLSGFKPEVDIPIVYTGLRPGEKLYEEKLMAEEGMTKTPNKLIHIGKPIEFDAKLFLKQLRELAEASYNNSDDVCEMVEHIVTTYHPAAEGQVNRGKTYETLMRQVAATEE